jgi:hypothetical protein
MHAFLLYSSHPLSVRASLMCAPRLHVIYAVLHFFVICGVFCPLRQSQIFRYGALCCETEVRKEKKRSERRNRSQKVEEKSKEWMTVTP